MRARALSKKSRCGRKPKGSSSRINDELYRANPAASRATNPNPTLPTCRLSAPLPDDPVAEAEAEAPDAAVAEPKADESLPNAAVEEAMLLP